MASIRGRLEEISRDDDGSSSLAAYLTSSFLEIENSLGTEDSLEQIRRSRNSNIKFNGDRGHYQHTDSVVEERTAWHDKFKPCCIKCMDITATVVVIFLIWMVMALPTVFYNITIRTQQVQMQGSNLTGGPENDSCTLYNEMNVECTAYLQQYANCLSTSKNVTVNVYTSGFHNYTALKQIFYHLNSFKLLKARQQCLMNLKPLICLHFIHLCEIETRTMIQPSETQCEYVKAICNEELKIVRSKLPMISEHVDAIISKCVSSSPLDNKTCAPRVTTDNSPQQVNCSEGFYRTANGSCVPDCMVWSPYDKTTILVTDILAILAAVVAVVSGVVVLLVSCIRCQKMYRYPTILIIYQTIPVIVQAILLLVGIGTRRQLFCRSRNFLEALSYPTPFCIITGMFFYYVVIHLLLWWLWHTIAVFWAVAWPFHARKFNSSRNNKYLHITLALASLLLPIAPVLVIYFVKSTPGRNGPGFGINRAPPFVCTGYDIKTNFWAFILPISIMLATGAMVLAFTMRIVIKKHILSKIYKIQVNLDWALELKVLIVILYYVFLGGAVLTVFTIALIDRQEFFKKFLKCESEGPPFNSSKSILCTSELHDVQRVVKPYPTAIALLVMGFLPVVNLVYIVKIKEIMDKLKCCQTRQQVQYIQRESECYVPYQVCHDPKSTFHHDSVMVHTRTVNTEPLISPLTRYS